MSLPSDQQLRVLALLPKISGGMSGVFSALMVYHIVFCKLPESMPLRRRYQSFYHRIMLALAILGFICGFALFLSTWPIPDTSWEMWVTGNETTCRVQGFFIQLTVGMALYYLSLSFFYLLTIRYSWREAQLKKWEWLFHGVPLCFALTTAVLCLVKDLFHSATLWCWIGGEHADKYRMMLYYGPSWMCIIVVCINLFLVFAHVRKITLTAEGHTRRSLVQHPPASSSIAQSEVDRAISKLKKESVDASDDELYQNQGFSSVQSGRVSELTVPDVEEEKSTPLGTTVAFASPSSSLQIAQQERQQQQRIASALSFAKRRQEVAMQSLRYAVSLIVTWLPISLIRIMQLIDNRPVPYGIFAWASFQAPLFLPLFMAYTYPYARDKLCCRPQR